MDKNPLPYIRYTPSGNLVREFADAYNDVGGLTSFLHLSRPISFAEASVLLEDIVRDAFEGFVKHLESQHPGITPIPLEGNLSAFFCTSLMYRLGHVPKRDTGVIALHILSNIVQYLKGKRMCFGYYEVVVENDVLVFKIPPGLSVNFIPR